MDASTQCSAKTGRTDTLTRVASFELAPFLFQRNHLIPAVKAECTLPLQANRGGLLPDGLGFNSQCLGLLQVWDGLLVFTDVHERHPGATHCIDMLDGIIHL